MRKLWQREYILRASDFDKYNFIKPSAVLDLFQDAAGQHALEIGVGFSDMINRGYHWVLTRVRFEIVNRLDLYQNVLVKTWPLQPNRLNYKREYCIEDKSGNLLVKGTSEWVVIDSVKRKFISVPDLYPFDDGFHQEIMYECKLSKVKDFQNAHNSHIVNTSFNDLDINDHVNNTKYANYVVDAINPTCDKILKEFQIDYRKEVLSGEKLEITYVEQENTILAKGINQSGETAFACEIICTKKQ